MRCRHSPSRYRGVFLLDVLTALIVMIALGTALMVAINRTTGAADKLANDREAIEAAQRTILALQRHQPAPTFDERTRVKVDPLTAGWVRVTAEVDTRTATITGWVGGAQ
jgi:hypothetical protein